MEPDFSSKELCDGCGVLDPLLVPGKLLLSGEYARLVKEITKLSGFVEQEDVLQHLESMFKYMFKELMGVEFPGASPGIHGQSAWISTALTSRISASAFRS